MLLDITSIKESYPNMKLLALIAPFLQALLAQSFIWLLIAFLACIPLGFMMLHFFERWVANPEALIAAIDHRIDLLYLAFAITCFIGVLLARTLAISIKVLAEKQLKPPES